MWVYTGGLVIFKAGKYTICDASDDGCLPPSSLFLPPSLFLSPSLLLSPSANLLLPLLPCLCSYLSLPNIVSFHVDGDRKIDTLSLAHFLLHDVYSKTRASMLVPPWWLMNTCLGRSKVWIEGNLEIDNDGLHSAKEVACCLSTSLFLHLPFSFSLPSFAFRPLFSVICPSAMGWLRLVGFLKW